MELRNYFDAKPGVGVLSTSDNQGRVDAAIYARPHIMDDETIAFIMANKLTYKNISENPHAVYLYKEDGPQYLGKRLYLTKVREESDSDLLRSLRRRRYTEDQERAMAPLHLVFFKIDQELALVGGH